jgi:hypothetical protein
MLGISALDVPADRRYRNIDDKAAIRVLALRISSSANGKCPVKMARDE